MNIYQLITSKKKSWININSSLISNYFKSRYTDARNFSGSQTMDDYLYLTTTINLSLDKIIAIYKKKNNLALGNIIGSCVANITVISLIAIILGGSINFYELLDNFNKVVFILTALVFYVIMIGKFASKITAIVFLLLYLIYILTLYI